MGGSEISGCVFICLPTVNMPDALSHICLQSTPNQPRPWPLIIHQPQPHTSTLTSLLFTPTAGSHAQGEAPGSSHSQRPGSSVTSVDLCWRLFCRAQRQRRFTCTSCVNACRWGVLYRVRPPVGAVWQESGHLMADHLTRGTVTQREWRLILPY